MHLIQIFVKDLFSMPQNEAVLSCTQNKQSMYHADREKDNIFSSDHNMNFQLLYLVGNDVAVAFVCKYGFSIKGTDDGHLVFFESAVGFKANHYR